MLQFSLVYMTNMSSAHCVVCMFTQLQVTFKSILQKESDEIQPVTQCFMLGRTDCGVIENSSVLFYFMMMV